jgi:hypothetical protein
MRYLESGYGFRKTGKIEGAGSLYGSNNKKENKVFV